MTDREPPIRYGATVKMHYSLTLMDGTEVVSTYHEAPLQFTLGDGTLEQPLEMALIGLRPGEDQSLLVSGDEIYGPADEENLHWIENSSFPDGMNLREEQIVGFTTAEGDEVAGRVAAVEPARILMDFNHPLSGKAFQFKVTILDVRLPE